MQHIAAKIKLILDSSRLTYVILGFFVFEALWVACSAAYPMAFDEDFHLGIIKLYSHHWLPFLSDNAGSTGEFGAVGRDPSYLYHWLMSYPYRLITAITGSLTVQVIVLRVINIALFGSGLLLSIRVLKQAGSSRALINGLLALFVLIPIVPLLAGQINYDNLMMPAVAGLCLLSFSVYQDARAGRINLKHLVAFACLCMLGALVKYAFLPMAGAATVFLAVVYVRAFYGKGSALKAGLRKSHAALGNGAKIGLLALLLTSSLLFVQRYGLNLSAYHTPVPDCAAVLTSDDCMSYGPWARNYHYTHDKAVVSGNPLTYTWTWLQGMHYRLFFMISGPDNQYVNWQPLPFPAGAAICIALFSIVAGVLYGRRLFSGHPLLVLLCCICLTYVAVLWVDNYTQFLETGQPVAINGRYLLLVLLPLGAVFGRGLLLALSITPKVKPWAAAIVLLCFLQGGGLMSFILRSDSSWYWKSSQIDALNHSARNVLHPIIIEGDKYY
ncbi:MAG TPA: hypothetical protein VLI54_05230 [Bacillota bacterium]|nr:hypothetical protein [Bacillota bacterium]